MRQVLRLLRTHPARIAISNFLCSWEVNGRANGLERFQETGKEFKKQREDEENGYRRDECDHERPDAPKQSFLVRWKIEVPSNAM
jgi:hypothetical protein